VNSYSVVNGKGQDAGVGFGVAKGRARLGASVGERRQQKTSVWSTAFEHESGHQDIS
jgi:hypothetical protein